MDIARQTAGPSPQSGPDQAAAMPARIAEILLIARILNAYGRRISGLIIRPAAWMGFVIVARFFGTATVTDIAARIQLGIMRAMALEAMLLRRTERGQDLVIPATRQAGPRQPSQAAKPPRQQIQPAPLTLDTLPSRQDVEAWVRRRPIGRTIAAICLDLGVAPMLCQAGFWDRLTQAVRANRGSVATVLKEVRRRVDQFASRDFTRPRFPWPDPGRPNEDTPLRIYIGQDLFHPAPAATAGPS